jgi:Na+/H+-dicarboxylate symporter
MELAPFGVFALITKTVAIGGIDSLSQYGAFVMTVLGALFTLLFVVGSLMVHFGTDFTPLQFFTGMREAMLTAFSTSSSAATIPVSLETVEKEFGVPERVASFLIPLGATMNMNGAAIYEAVVTLFIAQAWLPEPLTLSQQIFVVFMVLVATFGTPGIPHGSLVTLAVVFQAVGLPLEAIGVILSIYRILDMTRTMVNVTFDCLSCLMLNKMIKFDDVEHDLKL